MTFNKCYYIYIYIFNIKLKIEEDKITKSYLYVYFARENKKLDNKFYFRSVLKYLLTKFNMTVRKYRINNKSEDMKSNGIYYNKRRRTVNKFIF